MHTSTYDIHLNLGIKAALVADLHEKNPAEVISALKQVKPDLIFFPGDLWERQEDETGQWTHENMSKLQTSGRFQCFCYHFTQFISGNMFRDSDEDNRTATEKDYSNFFLRRASRIAPVFLSTGNHEWYYTHEDYEVIRQTGTTLLDNAYTHVEIKGQKLLIGGLSTRVDLEWLEEFLSATADHKILLCHHPEYVKRYVEDRGQVDLIVSGHAHGGQWRLFGRIPVYAPGQGLFPEYSKGVYETKAGPMVVTTGCANHISYPRFGNPCELVLLNL